MAEFHKMSAVINGLAVTCAMENKECEQYIIIKKFLFDEEICCVLQMLEV